MPVEKGVLIRSVSPGGSASNAGLRGLSQDADGEVVLGDIITSIDGTKVAHSDDVYRVLDKKQIGDTVQVEIYRGTKSQTVTLKLMSLPASVQGRPPTNKRQ